MTTALAAALAPGRVRLCGLPAGPDALFLARLASENPHTPVLHVARDDVCLARLAAQARFFRPDLEVLEFPAWDTVPYDRVSPNSEIVATRLATLCRLIDTQTDPAHRGAQLVITTVSAILQRLPPRESLAGRTFAMRTGTRLDLDALIAFLTRNGYVRSEQVMEPGEFAVRGGLIDLFAPGYDEPFRLDLFGDELDSLRTFDPLSQRTSGTRKDLVLRPMSEVLLDDSAIRRFRSRYRELFGAPRADDRLYESVSEGRTELGMEHWLPLFHEGMDTLFAYLPDAAVTLDHDTDAAISARMDLIFEYFEARTLLASPDRTTKGSDDPTPPYNPVPPLQMFLDREEFDRHVNARAGGQFSPFAAADFAGAGNIADAGGKTGHDFADVRARPGENVYEAVRDHVQALLKAGTRVSLAATSLVSRDRLAGLLREHGLETLTGVDTWQEATDAGPAQAAIFTLPVERGFELPGLALISETDILGDRMARPVRKKRLGDKFIPDISALTEGDLVVHAEHGIGQYDGLDTLDVAGAPHDCLRLIYADNNRLYVPVENIDVLTRYGSEQTGVQLDKLGGGAWQARKAKLKQRIRDMAEKLMQVAALRTLRKGVVVAPPEGLYDEFAARFAFAETDDQLRAIHDTLDDLASGRPMDRLVCGDVGFGKTEVALRAAFAAVMGGVQVAVVVPTTLLARQHYLNFCHRFEGLPVRIAQLSRLTTPREAKACKEEMAKGSVDIVIGTHALLAKSVEFRNLGLLIIDEEQHFGVSHKERLKQLRADVHVLTLTATPIPRTLQLALTGVREMSLIATPPVDRLAVRTFILPTDPVVIREALLRERYRGGQSFYVCPRLRDIDPLVHRLSTLVPDLRVAVAHGQMPASRLEEVMTAFSEGEYDILVATNIIESGLDIPRVNTIIIHRADMFGLAQLYQLRGRVGRSRTRGYAYLTVPPDRPLTKTANRRLEIMGTLDTLGAGFTLASHDLDIRGAGNLLGDEQSGHIREVGIELYQQMLEEAVAAARDGADTAAESDWSPQIQLGTPILIPEAYIADLGLRLSFYRRIAGVADETEIEDLAGEMLDRFGPLPAEVDNLLQVVTLKILCRRANVEKLDAGPKGAVLGFRENFFPNPAGLVRFIGQNLATAKLRPDHRLVIQRRWETPKDRLTGLRALMLTLSEIAREAAPEPPARQK
ncbi:transcription-repair coupling factor [Phaeovibrio sulfidiphilus]|uniref:Transcription-repair-coupling factor n=1 Tax=Phaeovibrio sulfidiphilus TaxID=1220600 RepID=A0A8J6YQ95_9PROT|nr:transcription-repair coupling factor [Phaeovibrio sulfidiphilus]MBE1237824.1 transcription-repair coupling factor [Phaeovibrio sulfidiphilus]